MLNQEVRGSQGKAWGLGHLGEEGLGQGALTNKHEMISFLLQPVLLHCCKGVEG